MLRRFCASISILDPMPCLDRESWIEVFRASNGSGKWMKNGVKVSEKHISSILERVKTCESSPPLLYIEYTAICGGSLLFSSWLDISNWITIPELMSDTILPIYDQCSSICELSVWFFCFFSRHKNVCFFLCFFCAFSVLFCGLWQSRATRTRPGGSQSFNVTSSGTWWAFLCPREQVASLRVKKRKKRDFFIFFSWRQNWLTNLTLIEKEKSRCTRTNMSSYRCA